MRAGAVICQQSGLGAHNIPVAQPDVCKLKSMASCNVDDETKWTPLDQWLASQ
jgi:hypothetical protein